MPELRALAAPRTRPLLILTALFLLSLPLVTTRIYASDEVQYFSYLRSLWFDRDVEFGNEYQRFYDSGVVRYPGFYDTFLVNRTETGRHVTFATIGSAILWSPFYAVADVVVRARRAMGATIEADGFSQPYVSAVAYGSAIYGWLTLVLSVLIVRRVLAGARGPGPRATGGARATGESPATRTGAAPRADADASPGMRAAMSARAGGAGDGDDEDVGWLALGAALAAWVGTPLFFYMYIAPPMSHACSAFAVALFVLAWLRVRERWSLRGMMVLGALAALAAMVREQEALVVAGPALDWLWTFVQRLRAAARLQAASATGGDLASDADDGPSPGRMVLYAIAGACAFVVAYAPQLLAYTALHGAPRPSRLVIRKMYWMAPHAFGVLASPRHGLLFWTPLIALSIAGLALLAFRGLPSSWRSSRSSPPSRSSRARSFPPAGSTAPAGFGAGGFGTGDRDAARIGICLLLIIATQVYVAGSVDSWTVAGAFGQRRFVGLTAVFVLGIAVFLRSLPAVWPRRVGVAAVALGIWWNLGLMAQFGTGLMDRQRLELGRNAYHSFVTIPRRLPELAWRYLFERRSFFKTTPPA